MDEKVLKTLLLGLCIGCLSGCASSAKNAPQEDAVQEVADEKAVEEKVEKRNDISIISTSAAICEILDLLDYDNVIGIPETAGEIPDRYKNAETVGEPMGPDMEIVKSMKADVVLSPTTLEASLGEQYEAAGVNAEFLNLSSVQGMYDSIDELGELLGREADALKLREEYEDYMEAYLKDVSQDKSCMIFMCFPSGYYLIATEKSYVGNLVELAGGANVYSNYQGDENGFVSINPEDMIQRNPEKIFVFAHYSEEEAFAEMKKNFETEEIWKYFDAVQKGEVYYLTSELFGMSATMKWKDSLEELKPMLYGE